MTNQVIPAEAADAAVDALVASKLGDHLGINGEEFVEAAIAALEAAAPHMLVPTAAEQAMDRILITLAAVNAGQVPQDVAFTVIREISEGYTYRRRTP